MVRIVGTCADNVAVACAIEMDKWHRIRHFATIGIDGCAGEKGDVFTIETDRAVGERAF